MSILRTKLLSGICTIIVCMSIFAGSAAAAEDLKLSTDVMERAKNAAYPSDLSYLEYNSTITAGELFPGIGAKGCTVSEILGSMEKYGYGYSREITKDTSGFLIGNFYFGFDWYVDDSLPMPAKVDEIQNKYFSNWTIDSAHKLDEELIAYYQTSEWKAYQQACEQNQLAFRIYPDTKLEVMFFPYVYDKSDIGFMESRFSDEYYDESREKPVSQTEAEALIERVSYINGGGTLAVDTQDM